jgi:hypothetical protein
LSTYSALEIVTKLCDLDFARKAKSVDLFHKTWEDLRQAGAGEGDKVFNLIVITGGGTEVVVDSGHHSRFILCSGGSGRPRSSRSC